MKSYDKMTKPELVEALKSIQSKQKRSEGRSERRSDRSGSSTEQLLESLQIHQIELEMQNRELREAQSLIESSRQR